MTADSDSDDAEPTDLKFVGPATAELLSDASFGPEAIRSKEVSFSMLLDAGVNPGVAARIRREHSLPWSFETENRQDLDRRSSQIRGLGDGERAWVAASSGDWTEAEAPAGVDATTETEENATADDEDDDSMGLGDWSITGGDWSPDGSEDAQSDDEQPSRKDGDWTPSESSDGLGGAAGGSGETADPAEADGSGDPVAAESAWRRRSAPVPVSELDGVDESVQRLLARAGITSVRSLANADPEAVAEALDIEESEIAELRESAVAHSR